LIEVKHDCTASEARVRRPARKSYRRGIVAAAGFLSGLRSGKGVAVSRNPVQFSATMMLFSG
jgi:hypothetical protein